MSKSLAKLRSDAELLREKLEIVITSQQYLSYLSKPGLFAEYAVFLSLAHSYLADIAAKQDMSCDEVEETTAYAVSQLHAFLAMIDNDDGSEESVKPDFLKNYHSNIEDIKEGISNIETHHQLKRLI